MSAGSLIRYLLAAVLFLLITVCVKSQSSNKDDRCPNCQSGCDVITGVCAGDCSDGYFGSKCEKTCALCTDSCNKESGKCRRCERMKYGDSCNKSCPAGCKLRCYQDTGVCHACSSRYYGPYCNMTCSVGCGQDCDKNTGECSPCVQGFWGESCKNVCPKNCKGRNCDQDDGNCWSCKEGFSGKNCTFACRTPNCRWCYHNTRRGKYYCTSCKDGFHGKHCEFKCSVNCDGASCEKKTGHCYKCKEGWFGEKCSHQCYKNCAKCSDNTTCFKCMSGFSGDSCNNKCPVGCARCSRDGDECYDCKNGDPQPALDKQCSCIACSSSCPECNKGWFFSGHDCCPCDLSKCTDVNDRAPSCGGNRTDARCQSCQNGYYGTYCTQKCHQHCLSNPARRCAQNTGRCLYGCEKDWYGSKCDVHCNHHLPHCTSCVFDKKDITDTDNGVRCVDCEEGYYLYNSKGCRKCPNCLNNKCDVSNGICIEGCTNGFHHNRDDLCTRPCSNCINDTCHRNSTCVYGCLFGYFHHHCRYPCPVTCKTSCDQDTGKCINGCKFGYYGEKCSEDCNDCFNNECELFGSCNEECRRLFEETCYVNCSGCVSGVCTPPTGCRNGCLPGLYGLFCNFTCPAGCLACEQFTGKCIDCKGSDSNICTEDRKKTLDLSVNFQTNTSCDPGWFGIKCDVPCTNTCAIRDQEKTGRCDRYTGACLYEGCQPGLYGLFCDKKCREYCPSSDDEDAICTRVQGICDMECDIGFYGSLCTLHCDQRCQDQRCVRSNGFCLSGCVRGWQGQKCNIKAGSGSKPLIHTLAAVLGPILGVISVAVLILLCYRLRSRPEKEYVGTLTEEPERKEPNSS